jgi:hypothetical protein
MAADDLLDQERWPPGPMLPSPLPAHPTADQQIRAAALVAAASWLPVHDGETELLATAARLADWIRTGKDPQR